jgi:hypothetical protein
VVSTAETLPGRSLLAAVILTLAAGFILTPFGADPSGRYFLPLAVPLALFAADLILALREKAGAWAWGLLGLVLIYNAWGTAQCALRYPPGLTTQFNAITQVDPRASEALIAFLLEHGEKRGYTNYWVAYPLAFLSGEELVFTPRLPYHPDFRYTGRDDRYAPYGVLVDQADRAAYITTNHPELDRYLRDQLRMEGTSWQEAQIGDFHVFYDIAVKFSVDRLHFGPAQQDAE